MLAVIGGGAYGTYHARQLLRARAAGAVAPGHTVAVVDRDRSCLAFRTLKTWDGFEPVVVEWSQFLTEWLETAAGPDDHVIPAPLMPHLLWSWLRDAAGAAECAPPAGWGLPYEVEGPPGVRFLSAAAWTCPATCIEPEACPALHAPRDWDLAEVIAARAEELGWLPAVLTSYHLAFGIASVPVSALQATLGRLRRAAAGTRALVATSSHCHAAIGGLRLDRSG